MSKSFELIDPIDRFIDEVHLIRCDSNLCEEILNNISNEQFNALCNRTGNFMGGIHPILHFLARANNYKVLKMLMNRGLRDIEWVSDNLSVLHMALDARSYEYSKILLENNANVNYVNGNGDTPLLGFISDVHIFIPQNEKILQLLVDYGANVNYHNPIFPDNNTALIFACRAENCINAVKILVNANININEQNNNGETALMVACKYSDYEVIKFLLDSGADTNITNNDGKNALKYITTENYIDICSLLIDVIN